MIIISLYLSYLGLFLLSLVLQKHYKELTKKIPTVFFKSLFSILGTILLTISMILLIKEFGLSIALSYWTGFLGVCIIFITMIYSFAPKIFFKLSIVLLILTLIFTLI